MVTYGLPVVYMLNINEMINNNLTNNYYLQGNTNIQI